MKIRLPFFATGLEIKLSVYSAAKRDPAQQRARDEAVAIQAETEKAWRLLIEQWDIAPESFPQILREMLADTLKLSAMAVMAGEPNPLEPTSEFRWHDLAKRIASPRAQNIADPFYGARNIVSNSERPFSHEVPYINRAGKFSHEFMEVLDRAHIAYFCKAPILLARAIEAELLAIAAPVLAPAASKKSPRL